MHMKKYSPYIKKYIKDINESGYTINDSGSQLSKRVGCYEIIITDLTVRSMFTKIKTVLVWIKNKETRTIEVERLYKHEVLPLPFHKIDRFACKTVAGLRTENTYIHESNIRKVVRHEIPEINMRKIKIQDITVEI